MLADINLLPKKPPKNIANHITILLTLLGVTMGLTYLYQESSTIQNKTTSLEQQKRLVQTDTARIEQEMEMIEATHSDIAVQQNIIEALNQTIYTTQVIAVAQSHLPDDATIANYTYSGGETLTFRIIVDETREVGNFVESISTVPWVEQARVESVTLESGTSRFSGNVTITLNREALASQDWGVRH